MTVTAAHALLFCAAFNFEGITKSDGNFMNDALEKKMFITLAKLLN